MSDHKAREARQARELEERHERAAMLALFGAIIMSGDAYMTSDIAIDKARRLLARAEELEGAGTPTPGGETR